MENDKVLQAIERLESRFDQIDRRFEQIDSRLDRSDSRFDKMENEMNSRFDALQGEINGVRVIIEMDVNKRIDLLYEGHVDIVNRLGRLEYLPEKVDNILTTLSIHDYAIRNHAH